MKTALIKTEKTAEGDKIIIKIVDTVNAHNCKLYYENTRIPSLGISYAAIQVNEATDLFLNPFLFNYIKSLLV